MASYYKVWQSSGDIEETQYRPEDLEDEEYMWEFQYCEWYETLVEAINASIDTKLALKD